MQKQQSKVHGRLKKHENVIQFPVVYLPREEKWWVGNQRLEEFLAREYQNAGIEYLSQPKARVIPFRIMDNRDSV